MTGTREPVPQFGERTPDVPCVDRPSAYCVILDSEDRVAIAWCKDELHLPGGGIEAGEDAATAVEREAREETGLEVEYTKCLGRANQFVYAPRRRCDFNKLATYYLARVIADHGDATAAGHVLVWVDAEQAAGRMAHESHGWAVRRALATRG